ncbi:transposase [Piscirickettsia salmonis]|uniref:transposase n=1 Tax=Piscirickettsia salmonis TaxID=1238 RepID=UPI0009BEA96C|nr:hypothetical protein C7B71_21225 [Bacillus halotolerans]QHS33998.1 hypothetical protein GW535_07505 [Piscirickettsia salmonis]QIX57031.1 hypothetical protein GW536_10380 [Piscirickettsia salmonis]RNC78329.1 hypothetical protein DA717_05295 [Piscirickettsiaceae bacterium NZ-RLO2]
MASNTQAGVTVTLDNASFHKSQKIQNLTESADCQVKYLPGYSPDLSPIKTKLTATK